MSQKGFAPILIILLVLLAIGGAYLLGYQKGNIVPASSPAPSAAASVEPSALPTAGPTTDPTLKWKTYSNGEFSFKYPDTWILEGIKISSPDKSIEMWAFPSDGALYNECMKLDSTQIVGNVRVKSFSGVTTAEMCDPVNLNLKEKWIVKVEGEGYQPGLQYSYKVSSPNAENIFNQILKTFSF